MPRHTHPKEKSKHSRAHTRAARQRYIEKRFARAKKTGALKAVAVTPRFVSGQLSSVARVREEKVNQELASLGFGAASLIESRYYSYRTMGGAHPEVLRHLPRRMNRQYWTPTPHGLGALATRDIFHWGGSGQPGCGCCWVEPEDKGRARTRYARELADELRDLQEFGSEGMDFGRRGTFYERTRRQWV